jgi:hypothetical protein
MWGGAQIGARCAAWLADPAAGGVRRTPTIRHYSDPSGLQVGRRNPAMAPSLAQYHSCSGEAPFWRSAGISPAGATLLPGEWLTQALRQRYLLLTLSVQQSAWKRFGVRRLLVAVRTPVAVRNAHGLGSAIWVEERPGESVVAASARLRPGTVCVRGLARATRRRWLRRYGARSRPV